MEIIILLLLTLLNAFFALSEIALVSVKKQKIEHKAEKGNQKAIKLLKLLEKPEDFLSSIQVGITLIGIISGAYGGATLIGYVEPFFKNLSFTQAYAPQISYTLIIAAITYVSIVFGELIPKTFGIKNPEKIALQVSPIIGVFSKIVYPFVKLLSFSTSIFNKIFGINNSDSEKISEEELRYMIKTASVQGVLDEDESVIHQKVFSFSDQKAKSLMTHRKKVEWLNLLKTKEEIEQEIKNSPFTKFPVCKGDLDEAEGFVTIKDYYDNRNNPNFTFEEIVRKPIFIPENMNSMDILEEFKENKQHFGFVVDEYGSFQGIITIQDLIEAILGDIPETNEIEEPEVVKRSDGTFLVNGNISVRDFNEYFEEEILEVDDDEYVTLAGFIIFHLEYIPEISEKLEFKGNILEIMDKDANRIDKVLFTKSEE